MKIIPATLSHVDTIASMLIHEYESLNNKIWVNTYKTNKEMFLQHVESKIRNPESWFQYFILVDDWNNTIWMLNTLISNQERWEILMVCINKEFSTQENYSLLLEHGINYLKWKNIKNIYFETHPSEDFYINALNQYNAKIFSNKWILINE